MDKERVLGSIQGVEETGEMSRRQRIKLVEWATPIAQRIVEQFPGERGNLYLSALKDMVWDIDGFVGSQGDLDNSDKVEYILKIFVSGAKIPLFDVEIPHRRLEGLLTVNGSKMLEKLLNFYSLEDK